MRVLRAPACENAVLSQWRGSPCVDLDQLISQEPHGAPIFVHRCRRSAHFACLVTWNVSKNSSHSPGEDRESILCCGAARGLPPDDSPQYRDRCANLGSLSRVSVGKPAAGLFANCPRMYVRPCKNYRKAAKCNNDPSEHEDISDWHGVLHSLTGNFCPRHRTKSLT